jgi:hypothetical protein
MAFEDTDRRRSLLLGVLTLIALPAIYLYSQTNASTDTGDDDIAAEDIAAEEVPVTDGEPPVTDNAANRPPITVSEADPIFLDGPVGDVNPGVNEIAIPQRPDIAPLVLSASYRSTVAGVRSCLVNGLTGGLSVSIKNLDNGRSITCVTRTPPALQVADVVLHADTFALLADPTEAPITIELTR